MHLLKCICYLRDICRPPVFPIHAVLYFLSQLIQYLDIRRLLVILSSVKRGHLLPEQHTRTIITSPMT